MKKYLRRFLKDKRVALLHLDGILTESKTVTDSPSVLDLIKRVEKQEIKALVVRINSPGGTVGAAQELFSTLRRLSEDNDVFLVASMGDVAASGGVYVALAADTIYAQPGTVTGSIGVIIKTGHIRPLMDRIGIHTESIKSGKYKDILSMDRPITDEERHLLQETTDDTYQQFVETVAQRRNLSLEKVKEFADGRIFTGRQALNLGLVDALGSTHEAIEHARRLARLSLEGPAKVIRLEKHKPAWKKILQGSMFTSPQALALHWLQQERALCGIPLWLMPSHAGFEGAMPAPLAAKPLQW